MAPNYHLDLSLAKEEDVQHIYEVHTSAIQEICSSHYSPQKINGWISGQTVDSYLTYIRKEVVYVGVIKDQVVGFGRLEKFSDCTGEIFKLYASPQHVKRVLEHISSPEDQAKLKGCTLDDQAKRKGCTLEDQAKLKGCTSDGACSE